MLTPHGSSILNLYLKKCVMLIVINLIKSTGGIIGDLPFFESLRTGRNWVGED